MEKISVDPEICHGKPCIKGTRIPVDLILELLENGASIQEIRRMYPYLTKNEILGCIEYAHKMMEELINEDQLHVESEILFR